MKKHLLTFVLLSLFASNVQADLQLGTDNPLTMNAGTTSGPMLVTVTSDNYPNDIMVAWQFNLTIAPISSTTGTLTFQDPGPANPNGTTLFPSNPANYIFSNGFGINAMNSGGQLMANDFDLNGGTVVPATGANLLQMDFLASSNASGVFGIYALEGPANTIWNNNSGNPTNQFFSNVPTGTGTVLIGQVTVTPAISVPEPPLGLLLAQAFACLGLYGIIRRKHLLQAV